jgi:Sec-independent protein translocase protein TatA
MGRTKRAISEVYEELKKRAKEAGLQQQHQKNKINGTKQENKNTQSNTDDY